VSRERTIIMNLFFSDEYNSMTMLISSGVSEKRKRQEVIELLFLPRVYHVLDNHHALCRSITSYSQTDLFFDISIHTAQHTQDAALLIETPKALPLFFQQSILLHYAALLLYIKYKWHSIYIYNNTLKRLQHPNNPCTISRTLTHPSRNHR